MISSKSSTNTEIFMRIGDTSCKRGRNPMEIPVCVKMSIQSNYLSDSLVGDQKLRFCRQIITCGDQRLRFCRQIITCGDQKLRFCHQVKTCGDETLRFGCSGTGSVIEKWFTNKSRSFWSPADGTGHQFRDLVARSGVRPSACESGHHSLWIDIYTHIFIFDDQN